MGTVGIVDIVGMVGIDIGTVVVDTGIVAGVVL